jgi:ribosomal-protein-alanine N-acetyltransferase
VVRPMSETDIDRVMAIARSLPTAPHWGRSAYEDALREGSVVRRIALVTEHTGETIGFVIARLLGPVAEIESIGIAEKWQGYGFGSSLLHATMEELKMVGVKEVELEVRASNEWAIRLYQRAGFSEVGRRREYYQWPVEDALLLRSGLEDE